jgi:hypothetical protein
MGGFLCRDAYRSGKAETQVKRPPYADTKRGIPELGADVSGFWTYPTRTLHNYRVLSTLYPPTAVRVDTSRIAACRALHNVALSRATHLTNFEVLRYDSSLLLRYSHRDGVIL